MAKHVTDKDMGFKDFMKFLKDAEDGPIVKVGVLGTPENIAPDTDGISLVGYASVNEFGTDKAGKNKNVTIPERSFIRSTVDEKKRSIASKSAHMQRRLFTGKSSIEQALGLMGEHIQNHIQDKIINLKDPPNKPSTIKKKGSSNPLVDTGRLKNSISYEVDSEGSPLNV
jgi:phage gpG-like protein